MSDRSTIEWTDSSWNPIRARNLKTGKIGWHCEHSTTGCEFCYAESFNKRLGTGLPFKPGHRKDIEIFLDEKTLLAPLHWKKPRRIFVCSTSDLFADFVKDEWIDKVFSVMALCPQHTFQALTKRAKRMRDYFAAHDVGARWAIGCFKTTGRLLGVDLAIKWDHEGLPNVWLGVSCERQEEADERIPLLLQTRAAVRFISAEPLLGPISLARWLDPISAHCARGHVENHLTADQISYVQPSGEVVLPVCRTCGGESGHGARPMHPQWTRDLRDQCVAAGVRFFFKQWGEWRPGDGDCAGQQFYKVGKKAAGRLLDGVEHNNLPSIQNHQRGER